MVLTYLPPLMIPNVGGPQTGNVAVGGPQPNTGRNVAVGNRGNEEEDAEESGEDEDDDEDDAEDADSTRQIMNISCS